MGSPADEWGHPAQSEDQVTVTLTRGFLIQQTELTQGQWVARGLPNPSGTFNDGTGDCIDPECPVGNITWFEAAGFANLLSEELSLSPCYELTACTGELGAGVVCGAVQLTASTLYACEGYRLPTEAEWEYAARAGTTTPYHSGDTTVSDPDNNACLPDPMLDRIAWYCANASELTHPVSGKEPNAWGLHDVSGNAKEWVHDHYTPEGYGDGPLTDPDGTIEPQANRVYRSGGFHSWNTACRSAAHLSGSWDGRGPVLGVRLVRTQDE